MPAEVISLLSSSPVAAAPSPPILSTSTVVPSRTDHALPSRALSYGATDLTAEPSSKRAQRPSERTSRESTTGVTRARSDNTRQDDNYLFLSDDFDTTGDLDGNVAKKPRTCTSTLGTGKREECSFKRTKSAAVSSGGRQPRPPTGLKRWNSVADPIEYSSSPNGSATRENSSEEIFCQIPSEVHRASTTRMLTPPR